MVVAGVVALGGKAEVGWQAVLRSRAAPALWRVPHAASRVLFYELRHSHQDNVLESDEAELDRRYAAGEIGGTRIAAELRGMPPVFTGYGRIGGRLLDNAEVRGDLPAADWKAACDALWWYSVDARSHVRQGAVLPDLYPLGHPDELTCRGR